MVFPMFQQVLTAPLPTFPAPLGIILLKHLQSWISSLCVRVYLSHLPQVPRDQGPQWIHVPLPNAPHRGWHWVHI